MIDSNEPSVDKVPRILRGGHIKAVDGVRDIFPASSYKNLCGRRVPGN